MRLVLRYSGTRFLSRSFAVSPHERDQLRAQRVGSIEFLFTAVA
jgi:hypothetical protein